MIQLGVMNEMMEEVIGELEVELDGRFSSIRNKETNLGKHTFSFLIMAVYWPYIYFLKGSFAKNI